MTNDAALAARMRQMSLHGLSQDAWKRYDGGATWDYRIIAPGFKYNLTDIAAALGIHQLARAEQMRLRREAQAQCYLDGLKNVAQLEMPTELPNRIHSWHLFWIRLRLERLSIDRNRFFELVRERGVGCSVHWRPLHLHPYYQDTYGWSPEDLPAATMEWERLISLPIYPGMQHDEQRHVITVIRDLCAEHAGPADNR